jgi:hypothetical protein
MKRALVFAGTVLILAACDSATSPTSPISANGSAASMKKKDSTTAAMPSSGTTQSLCGGYWIQPSGDSVWVDNCIQQQ